MNKDITELITELEDIILNSVSKKDAEHEGTIFIDNHGTIDNEGYLQYRLRYLLGNYDDIRCEQYSFEEPDLYADRIPHGWYMN